MSSFNLNRDMAAGVAAIALGFFVFVAAGSIEGFGDDPVGPRFVPRAVAALIILIGALLALQAWVVGRRNIRGAAQADGPQPSRIGAVAVLSVLSFAYALLFQGIGYLPASILIFPAVLYVFGMNKIGQLVSYTIGALAAFYIFFFIVLGVHDPPGMWFDPIGFVR